MPDPIVYDPNSILDSIKKLLGIDVLVTAFDQDIIMHINGVLYILTQIGVGPVEGFSIIDRSATWSAFLGTIPIGPISTYIYLRVRLLFDPPQTSFLIEPIERQIKEIEYRLTVKEDTTV